MKQKTHSGTKKRVKLTGTGKFLTAKIGKRHLLQNKSRKSKGANKYGGEVHIANERKMKWGHKVAGKRTPAKKSVLNKTADGKIIKAVRVLKIKTVKAPVASKKVAAPKAVKAAAPKKAPAKKSAPKKK